MLFTTKVAHFCMPINIHRTSINPARLLVDTLISMILIIFVFALWYRKFGIEPSFEALNTVYFSAVTFSTLGFGDFAPKPYSQPFAAIQAIFGNLHLGFIVGAVFVAAQRSKKSEE